MVKKVLRQIDGARSLDDHLVAIENGGIISGDSISQSF